jgi:glyoxylase-like metal-dependent hydrolase (beta-lactamase superfamily II)
MEVAQGVHRLTGGVCNFYLLQDGGKLVLVDAGAPGDWNLLLRTLATLGRGLEDLEAVLLTHAHSDHRRAIPVASAGLQGSGTPGSAWRSRRAQLQAMPPEGGVPHRASDVDSLGRSCRKVQLPRPSLSGGMVA